MALPQAIKRAITNLQSILKYANTIYVGLEHNVDHVLITLTTMGRELKLSIAIRIQGVFPS